MIYNLKSNLTKEEIDSLDWNDFSFYWEKQVINTLHEILDSEGNVVFTGTVKNKKDLIKLRKQLCIQK